MCTGCLLSVIYCACGFNGQPLSRRRYQLFRRIFTTVRLSRTARTTRHETFRANQVARFEAPTTGRALSALDDLTLSTGNDRLFALAGRIGRQCPRRNAHTAR